MRSQLCILAATLQFMELSPIYPAFADTDYEQADPEKSPPTDFRIPFEFPVVDVPFNTTNGGRFPSMRQSLSTTKNFYYLSHWGLEQFLKPRADGIEGFASRFGIVVFDAMTISLPFASAWLHEEYHRAVMANRNIDSHNGVYDFRGGDVIPVDRVNDDDLVRLKRDHPADQIRMGSAGMEAEHDLGLSIEIDHFFFGTSTFDGGILWLSKIGPASYLSTCASESSTDLTREMNEIEKEIPSRDFTGLDCNGWVYDLFRSTESYESRGIHPAGNGIDRYRDWSDLTAAERKYLTLQSQLSYINFVDPFLIGRTHFNFSPGWFGLDKWNFNLRHEPTSFGHTVDTNFFFKNESIGYFASVHLYQNHARVFPGLELMEFLPSPTPWDWSYRAMLWQQPKNQQFFATQGVWGGLLSARLTGEAFFNLRPFFEVEAKTAGWVAGVVSLDQAIAARVGISTVHSPFK